MLATMKTKRTSIIPLCYKFGVGYIKSYLENNNVLAQVYHMTEIKLLYLRRPNNNISFFR